MPNQNGTKTAADLDLSHIPGIENLNLDLGRPSQPAGEPSGSEVAPAPSEPSEPVDYSAYTGDSGSSGDPAPAGNQGPAATEPAQVTPDAQAGLWDPLLQQIPEPLHAELQPTLAEYQRQLSRRDEQLERLTPFQEWIDRGLTPQDIVMALQTQQQILQDPRQYWSQLGERYGWNQPQIVYAQPPAAPNQAAPAGEFDDIFGTAPAAPTQPQPGALPPELQQAVQEIQQSRAEIQQFQEQQRQAALVQEGRARIDAELSQLEQRYGQFDRQEVMRRAFANGQTGGSPSLTEAFHQMKDYENQITRRYAAQRPAAPAVIGGGNGMTPPVKTDLSTPEARANAAFQLALQLGADDPNGGYRK